MATPTTVQLFEAIARTATHNSSDIFNYGGHRGVALFVDVDAIVATPSIVFTVQGKDEYTGNYYTIGATAAVVAVGQSRLLIYPGLTVVANSKIDDVLPLIWRVLATHGDADSITYKVGATLQP